MILGGFLQSDAEMLIADVVLTVPHGGLWFAKQSPFPPGAPSAGSIEKTSIWLPTLSNA